MDSPEDLRAAIAELARQQTRLGKQIAHREEQARARQAEADAFKRELEDVVDRWLALIAQERALDGDSGDDG